MKPQDLQATVRNCYQIIEWAQTQLNPSQYNEEWTKQNLVLPLLEAVGWDRAKETFPESQAENSEGAIDYLCKPEESNCPSMGVEAKRLDATPPPGRDSDQISKGLKQSEDRGASYFAWTNGDTWQVLSLGLPQAPIYQVTISKTNADDAAIEMACDRLQILGKAPVCSGAVEEAIRDNWKRLALPNVRASLLGERSTEFLALVKRSLPSELEFRDEEILEHFGGYRRNEREHPSLPQKAGARESFVADPEEWQKLVSSNEAKYENEREKLLKGNRRRLAEYLLSEQYESWHGSSTYLKMGLPKETNARRSTGPLLQYYSEVGFITLQNPREKQTKRRIYERVDAAMPYLKQLLHVAE